MDSRDYPIAEGVPDEFRQMQPVRGIVCWRDGREYQFDGGQWQLFNQRNELTPEEDEIMWRVNRSRTCAYCGAAFDASRRPHIDHIVPWAQGGSSKATNYVRVCHRCNSSKGTHSLADWAQTQTPETRERCLAIWRSLGTTAADRLATTELVDLFYPESDLVVGNHRPRRNSGAQNNPMDTR